MVGADPSFGDVHLLRTLFILDSGTVGRKKLVKLLGVGEGSVRTIIKRLSGEGLVGSTQAGHHLTDAGKEHVEAKLSVLSKPSVVGCGDLVPSAHKSLTVVKASGQAVGSGVGLRDVALKAGADGAVILVYDGGLRFPDSSLDLSDYPEAVAELGGLDLNDGDVVVIGFASSPEKAEDGALAVALELFRLR